MIFRMVPPFRIAPLCFALAALALLAPDDASAQYKNSALGLDLGGWLITKPTVLDGKGNILTLDNRPMRLSNGLRIGGESNFKMDNDHWWFIARLGVGILQYTNSDGGDPTEAAFDAAARDTLGTLLGVQGLMGARYYVLTDRFRPYLQLSMSYLRLISFSSQVESGCDIATVCGGTESTNEANFLPHPNVGALHVQPGVEVFVARDMALHMYVDMQRWLIFNAADNNAVVVGLGFTFYT